VVMSRDINDNKDYLHKRDFKSLPFLRKREGGVPNATSSLESQNEEYIYVKDLTGHVWTYRRGKLWHHQRDGH
jgi:hypothetical protein